MNEFIKKHVLKRQKTYRNKITKTEKQSITYLIKREINSCLVGKLML